LEAIILLCDFAEAVNNKLYMMGAGFSAVLAPRPVSMSLAVRIEVPWNATNQQHKLHIGLETGDGHPVADPESNSDQVAAEAEFGVGRPMGVPPGSALPQAMAFRIEGLDIPSGSYVWVVKINDSEVARAPFVVERQDAPGGSA
jgi:hypothetical protein